MSSGGITCRWLLSAMLGLVCSASRAQEAGVTDESPAMVAEAAAPAAPTQEDVLERAVRAAAGEGFLPKPGFWKGTHPAHFSAFVCAGNAYQVLVVAIPPMGAPVAITDDRGKPVDVEFVVIEGALVKLAFTAGRSGRVGIHLPEPAAGLGGQDARAVVAMLYK